MSHKFFPSASAIFPLLLCFTCFSIGLRSQSTAAVKSSVTDTAPHGYFSSPLVTPYGIVCSNEFSSSLYLINNGEMKKIISAPGCGRYVALSPDKRSLGFKLIDPSTGQQTPAVCDLQTLAIEKLWEPVEYCGQPSFAGDGTIVFTVGTRLVVKNQSSISTVDLGVSSNRTPVSPDGRYIIYNDNDQLWKFELATGMKELLTDNTAGYGDAQWSFDGSRISFQSIDARIFVKDLRSGVSVAVSEGENARWAPDAATLVFHKRDIDMVNAKLNNSDIYLFDAGTNNLRKITETPGIVEMDASFSGRDIVYQTYGSREILKSSVDKSVNTVLFKSSQPLEIAAFNETAARRIQSNALSGTDWDYVHIHQVFQTGSTAAWYNDDVGYSCCGASSAMEAIASYKILPPDPIYSYGFHVYSPYGKYISDPYTYNGITYSGFGGSWTSGGHGCLWNNGSPYSNIVAYLTNHGVTSTRTDYVSWSGAMAEISLGYPYIVCSTGLTAAHIVMIVRQYGTGHTVYVNDPYGDKNPKGYDHSKIDGKNAIYDWMDANSGHQQIGPLPWAVSARYQRRVQLYSTYPKNGQTNVSTTAAIKVLFSDPILSSSVDGNFSLIDGDGKTVAIRVDTTDAAFGLVIVEPASALAENAAYKLVVQPALQSTTALTLLTSKELTFTTGVTPTTVAGRTVDNFEDAAYWTDPNTNSKTVGTIAERTFFATDKNHSIAGQASGKLTYAFSSTSGGFCYVKNSLTPDIGASADTSFGMWVYGDASNNLLGYWFYDEQQVEKTIVVDTLTWTGWKFCHVQLSSIPAAGRKYFIGLVVKQLSNGLASGAVYFDQATLFLTAVKVNSASPAALTNVDTLSSVIINFNKPMDRLKCQQAFHLIPQTTGTFTWENNDTRLLFVPDGNLKVQTTYTVAIDTTAADLNGLTLKTPYTFTFKTIRVELLLVKNYPAVQQTDISKTVQIRLTFDGAIDPSSLAYNISMTDASDKTVSLKVSSAHYPDGIIIFSPSQPLAANALYKIKLKSGIKDTEKMVFRQNLEILFFTEASTYADGAVADSFDTISGWKQPAANQQSRGVVADATDFTLSAAVKYGSAAAGKLAYTFSGTDGVCVLEKTPEQAAHTDGAALFGMWVYGDFSGNILEYRFKDNTGRIIRYDVDTVNWTGWKMKNVVMKEKTIQSFSQIALRQANGADCSGELYFDNLQFNSATSVSHNTNGLPLEYSLGDNYPNPFNPATVINYSLPFAGRISLAVYDVLGNEVAVLVNEDVQAGYHSVKFDVSKYALSSGVYFYRISASPASGGQGFTQSKKMMFLK
jgi:hypothetical protein